MKKTTISSNKEKTDLLTEANNLKLFMSFKFLVFLSEQSQADSTEMMHVRSVHCNLKEKHFQTRLQMGTNRSAALYEELTDAKPAWQNYL